MLFRVNTSLNKFYVFGLALLFTVALAGCGGGGGSKKAMDTDTGTGTPGTPETPKTPEQIAEEAVAAERKRVADEAEAAKAEEELAAEEEKARVASNKMFETKATAIENEGDATANTGAFDDEAPYTLKISHKDGAASVEVTDPLMPAKNDPQFEMMDGKYVRDNGNGVAEIVGVHTDIDAPKDIAFGKEYTLTVGNATPDRTTPTPTTYEVAGGEMGDHGKVASPEFPSKPDSSRDFLEDDDDAATPHDGTFPGTFDGASGTFKCIVEMCTITTDDKGKIEELTALELQFTPDDGETVSKADDDYLHYGFWLMKTVKDGVTTYNEVQTFAGSSLATTTGISDVVDGSAKYEGNAAGVYAYNTVKADSSVDNRSAGTFTADVALTAYFGAQSSVAMDKHNKVEGTVSNFELSGGEANTWEATLSPAGDLTSDTDASFENGVTMVKGQENGTWSASFHGNGVDLDGDGGESDVAPPPVVVGEFDANFANGSVAGGFGARYKK